MNDGQSDAPTGRAIPEVLTYLLGEAVDGAEVGVFVFDDHGSYVAANEYGAGLLGLPVKDLLGRRAGDFTVGNEPPPDIDPGSHRESAQMVRRADGEWVPLAFVAVPTTVSRMSFRIAAVWPLDPGDPRAVAAADQLAARQARLEADG